jgi:hypothetical protein
MAAKKSRRATKRIDGEWIAIEPNLLLDREARFVVRRAVRRLMCGGVPVPVSGTIVRIREEQIALARGLDASWAPDAVFVINVLADLRSQGWLLRVERRGISAMPPVANVLPVAEEKNRIRAAHLIERDAQLRQPAVRRFIMDMERRRPHRGEWHSIFSLMRDGRQLAALAEKYAELPIDNRADALRGLVDPYVQVVKTGQTCELTGLALLDIWRYFRHTWTTTYQSTPGRKMFFLIRDRAAPNHPVVGIGALGSAVVQLSVRDEWIGWTAPRVVAAMREAPTAAWARWLDRSVHNLIDEVLISDLVHHGDIRRGEIKRPTPEVVERLLKLSKTERATHHLYPDRGQHKRASTSSKTVDWRNQALTHLFRSKRAKALADLLEARRRLQEAGFIRPVAADLKKLLKSSQGVRAVQTVLRRIKGGNVGIHMMDITVCGAVAPYNHLIGGKLVSLLMASPDVVQAYNYRYRKASSVIASSIAGEPVQRKPHLVLLGTTSLYGAGASQYNRLRMPADLGGGRPGDTLEFKELGKTVGYGSYHFSAATMEAIEPVVRRLRRGRPVNSIFGEGVNPKLRKVRGALDVVGLPSDLLLQHGSPRIVYAIPVAANFRNVLLGRSKKPEYLLPAAPIATEGIANFWRGRWLAQRIEKPEVIDSVAAHTLTYPITHGARVVLPELAEEAGTLFSGVARPRTVGGTDGAAAADPTTAKRK